MLEYSAGDMGQAADARVGRASWITLVAMTLALSMMFGVSTALAGSAQDMLSMISAEATIHAP